MTATWITRGKKPDRVVEAMIAGALVGGIRTWANGGNPWIGAAAQGVASANAMTHHRLADRERAHRANSAAAEKLTDAMSSLAEAMSKAKKNETVDHVGWITIVEAWNNYVRANGCDPSEIGIPREMWTSMPAADRTRLVSVSQDRGVRLRLVAA